MSLINVFLTPSKAMIGVDTEALEEMTSDFRARSKMLHLPHLNVIMASRGENGFMLFAFSTIAQGKTEDFDALAKTMPEILAGTHSLLTRLRPDFAESPLCDEQQVVLVGWSAEKSRMRAILFEQINRADGFNATEVDEPGYMMPWEDRWGEAPEGDDHRAMFELASAQTRHTRRESAGTPMGGRLLIAELTRHGMAFTSAGDLPEPRRESMLEFSQDEIRRIMDGSADPDLAGRYRRAREITGKS